MSHFLETPGSRDTRFSITALIEKVNGLQNGTFLTVCLDVVVHDGYLVGINGD